METKSIPLEQNELAVYLQENSLDAYAEYNPESSTNKKQIFQSALGVLESVANDVSLMNSVKLDDMTISDFSESIQNRINQLERKIRTMKTDEEISKSNPFFVMFD